MALLPLSRFGKPRLDEDGDTEVDDKVPRSCTASSCISSDMLFSTFGKTEDAVLAHRELFGRGKVSRKAGVRDGDSSRLYVLKSTEDPALPSECSGKPECDRCMEGQ